jgi:hypothetical protein
VGAAALALDVLLPRQAPTGVESVGEGASEDLGKLESIIVELRRSYRQRAAVLDESLDREPTLPEAKLVAQWYRAHGLPLGRPADELLALRYLVRDAENTARDLGPEGVRQAAIGLAWIRAEDQTLAAAIAYTNRPALSFDEARRVPYVYNLWSSVPGLGRRLLEFVAWQTGRSVITLHPLHDGVAAHYARHYRVSGSSPE